MLKESLKQKAYRLIKAKIISCEYAPGTGLTEAFLLEDTSLSRTPIRDALGRLEQEGLVSIISKKGMRVSDVTINDIKMVWETRNLVEPYIIRQHGEKLDKAALLWIKEQFALLLAAEAALTEHSSGELEMRYALDDKLHRHIVRSSGNTYLETLMNQINNQNIRLRIMTSITHRRLIESHNEHTKIIDHLLAGQYEHAAFSMEEHLLKFREASFSAIIKNGGWVMP